MFTDNISLICRRCAQAFELDENQRRSGLQMDRFECPTCNYESTSPGLKAFLMFYPRLVNSNNILTIEGIKWVSYTIGDIMDLGIYNWLKETIKFKCQKCGTEWNEKFDPDTLTYKQNPQLFHCQNCFHSPNTKSTREFFMAMNQVFEGSMKLTHVQWDLFSPIGLKPPLKQIQSKIYAEKFKI